MEDVECGKGKIGENGMIKKVKVELREQVCASLLRELGMNDGSFWDREKNKREER